MLPLLSAIFAMVFHLIVGWGLNTLFNFSGYQGYALYFFMTLLHVYYNQAIILVREMNKNVQKDE